MLLVCRKPDSFLTIVSISLEKSLNFTENVENIHHSVYSDVDLNY